MKNFILIFFILICGIANSQFEMKNWYYGPGIYGISYNYSSGVYSFVNNQFSTFGNEGCITVNNPSNGNLLFYSDGIRIVDAGHQVMPNGSGLNGHVSGSQSAAVCPDPAQCGQYYVFSNSCTFDGSSSGVVTGSLYYSKVDMSLPGNGTIPLPKGNVITGQKNILISSGVTEALISIPKKYSKNHWLIVHKPVQNNISIYEVTTTGIVLNSTFTLTTPYTRGITFSTNKTNDKIVLSSHIGNEPVLLFNFDSALGTISSETIIPGTPFNTSFSPWCPTYDHEFSEDGTKLYISKYRYSNTSGPGGQLYQYDLNTPLVAPLLIAQISASQSYVARGLRRGPDGRILFLHTNPANSQPNIVGVINNPNLAGLACGYNSNFINYPVTNPGQINKFPTFLTENHPPASTPINTTINSICSGDTTFTFDLSLVNVDEDFHNLIYSSVTSSNGFLVNTNNNLVSISIPSGFTGSETLSYLVCDDHCFSLCDTGTIVIQINNNNNLPYVDLGSDNHFCTGSSFTINPTLNGFNNLIWNTGSTSATITVTTPGIYWLEASNACGVFRDSIFISEFNAPVFQLPNDTSFCTGSTINFPITINGFSSVVWQNGSTNNTFVINSMGTYFATVTDTNGCSVTDSINVNLIPVTNINLGSDTSFCQGIAFTLTLNPGSFNSVLWSDGSTDPTLIVSSFGTFSVVVIDINGCPIYDTIQVLNSGTTPSVNLGNDAQFCPGSNYTITPTVIGGSGFLWNTGSISATITVSNPGIYWLEVSNSCGVFRDSIFISEFNAPVFQLPNDTSFCTGSIINFPITINGFSSVVWQDGSTNNTFIISSMGTYFATVTDANGCNATDSIIVSASPATNISLGSDTSFCQGSSFNLVLNPGVFNSVLWSDGSTDPTLIVSSFGTFSVTVSDVNGCISSDSLIINTLPSPVFNFGPSYTGCPLQMEMNISNVNFLWSTGETSNQIYIQNSGVYYLTVTNNFGCSTTDSILITISQSAGSFLFIPNVFSPNNDQINDVFKIAGNKDECNDALTVQIYNRWGQLLFSSEIPDFEWDGNDLNGDEVPDGVYYVLINGVLGGVDITRNHTVTLLR